jgi:hypothetical protein
MSRDLGIIRDAEIGRSDVIQGQLDQAQAEVDRLTAERDRAIAAELRRQADHILPGYRATYIAKRLLARADELEADRG